MKLQQKLYYWRYLGYDKETLASYDVQVAEDNLKVFAGALVVAGVITLAEFLVIIIFALSGKGVTDSLWTTEKLLIVTTIMIVVVGTAYLVVRNRPNKAFYSRIFTTILLACWSILYIIIGTSIDPEDYAVVACGLFLLIQIIFNSYPLENVIFVFCVYTVFAVMSFINKSTMIFMYDLIDALPFVLVGLFLSWTKSRSKWASLINADAMVQLETQKLENELLQSRVAVMMSQIQPHFLYNSLGTIKALCIKNPQLAREALDHFTRYLRANMKSVDQKTAIPFAEELVHIENYLFIEKLRFGDELSIQYDIQSKDFQVPPLSLQTMVENAVKHGIRKKGGGGILTIRSFDTDKMHCIEVIDTGAGFDITQQLDDGQTHIGIVNTKARVKEYRGTFSLISEIGAGTKVTIEFPKE